MTDKEKAIQAAEHLLEDLDLLEDGSWIPEKHSIQASRDNVEYLLDYVKTKT